MKSIFTTHTLLSHKNFTLTTILTTVYDERGEVPVTQDVQHAERQHVHESVLERSNMEECACKRNAIALQLYGAHSSSGFHKTVANYIS
jgi:hypothetical protein